MKKNCLVFVMAIVMIFTMTACGGTAQNKNAADDGKLSVVATIFPEYDWAREVIGDASGADLDLLVDNGSDLHSFQPSADDIMKISSADIFIYVGGESDEWVSEVLEKADNEDMKVICLMDILGDEAKEEEEPEGAEEHEHEEEEEYDEHVWLSLRNAVMFCEEIKDALCEVDEENRETYEKNAGRYIEKLQALDLEYDRMTADTEKNVLVFGDRFPFRYLTDDYGIRYYAAFSGCSAETEASFETVRFLAGKVDESGLDCVMTIDGSDGKIAKTVSENTKSGSKKILMLDSMQSVTEKEIDEGASYLGKMKENLKVLEEALGTDR